MDILKNIKGIFSNSKGEVLVDKASKGIAKESFYSHIGYPQQPIPPSENLNTLLDIFSRDPIVNAGLSTRANAINASGYTIEGAKKPKEDAEKLLKKLGFNYLFLDKLVLNFLLYGNTFIEIVRDRTGAPAELHILETTEMEIEADIHGEIQKYYQLPSISTDKKIEWSPEDIVFIKLQEVSTRVWGVVPMASLYRTLTTKNLIEKFINTLAVTNAWREVFKTEMSDDDIPVFLAYLRTVQADPSQPFVMKVPKGGEDKNNKFEVFRDPKDLKEFLGVLDYLRTQILMELKVPPIMIGIPDNSNRSNSDSQIKAFNIENESVRRKLDIAFEELFKKLGIPTVNFSWNPVDKRSEKDDIEIAKMLYEMGAKPKQLEQFLRNVGLELPEGELFDPKPDPMEMMKLKAGNSEYKKKDPSAEMTPRKSGADSSTREDQL